MPITDGIQTLKIMRENGLSVSTPVIALTAEALSGSEEKFISAGFSAYLSKPISWHSLEKMLIAMLPADKVIICSSSEDIISSEELYRLSELMKKYDISLDSGLSYLSGNLTRFCTLAKIFSDGYERSRESLENMFDSGSDRLIFEIHSLKSAAKGIGAISLFEIAKTMEEHLASGDCGYAEHARELLMFEWKRAAAGMKLLVSETADNGGGR